MRKALASDGGTLNPLDDRQLAALHPEFPDLSRSALDVAHLVFTLTARAGADPAAYVVVAWGHKGTTSYHRRRDFVARCIAGGDPFIAAAVERLDLPIGCLPMLLIASDGTWRTCGAGPGTMLVSTNAPGGKS